MAAPPELNPDAVAEILLRLPPDNPAGLVRASAVCKPWLRTLTDPAFLRSYRDFHGTPRVLGFLRYMTDDNPPCFVPTTAFRPHAAAAAAHRTCTLQDCRHGRVFLCDGSRKEFVVWDPITGRERRIPYPPGDSYYYHAVLCAAAATGDGGGCDHSTCSGGPFLIACADTYTSNANVACACTYSSETGAWSEPTIVTTWQYCSLGDLPPALVGGTLYFDASFSGVLLRYDVLGARSRLGLSTVDLPDGTFDRNTPIVMTAANGGLGLTTFQYDDETLTLWSTDPNNKEYATWSQIKIINLRKLLPFDDIGLSHCSSAWVSGFAEDANLIFFSTYDEGIFTFDLKSLLVRKVSEMDKVKYVLPYVSFYTPAAFARGTLQSPVESVILQDPTLYSVDDSFCERFNKSTVLPS